MTMTRTNLPLRIVTRREAVATTASIARSALNQRKAERARRTATLVRQSLAREVAE
jgi:hypothetical protein